MRAQNRAYLAQNVVSSRMAMPVIVAFEIVDIENGDGSE
jgi:hypothetical protein